jgi:hypothetical protein
MVIGIAFAFKKQKQILLTKVREQKQVMRMFAPHVSGANIFFLRLLLKVREQNKYL